MTIIIISLLLIPDIGMMVRVFANGPRDLGFNPRSSHTKDSRKKMVPSAA